MADNKKKRLDNLDPKKALWPLLLGAAVFGFLLYKGFDPDAFLEIQWNWVLFSWVFFALLMVGVRHLAYMYRVRLITGNQLSWRASFELISVWEFASAVTPSTVGGAAVALFLLAREKVSLGRSTAVVMLTMLLDNLFFVLLAPVFLLMVGREKMFPANPDCLSTINFPVVESLRGIENVFIFGYLLFFVFVALFVYGLFVNPEGLKRFFAWFFSIKVLWRWRMKALRTGQDLVIASVELKKKPARFWVQVSAATLLSWTARYLVLNLVLTAFGTTGSQLIIFARQFVMWIIMLIPTTPGSSGIAELSFLSIQCEFIPAGLSATMVLLWRFIGYYLYLLAGVLILPRWLARTKQEATQSNPL